MALVRLLGFTTLPCGCIVGKYRESSTDREITYVEEKGSTCTSPRHRRNQVMRPVTLSRTGVPNRARAV